VHPLVHLQLPVGVEHIRHTDTACGQLQRVWASSTNRCSSNQWSHPATRHGSSSHRFAIYPFKYYDLD